MGPWTERGRELVVPSPVPSLQGDSSAKSPVCTFLSLSAWFCLDCTGELAVRCPSVLLIEGEANSKQLGQAK